MASEKTKRVVGSILLFILYAIFTAIFGSIFLLVIAFVGKEFNISTGRGFTLVIAGICFFLGFLVVRKIMHNVKKEIETETKEFYSFRWMPISPFLILYALIILVAWRYQVSNVTKILWTVIIILTVIKLLTSYKIVTFQTNYILIKYIFGQKLIQYQNIIFVSYGIARFRRGEWDIFLFHLKNKKEEKLVMMTLNKYQREIFIRNLKKNKIEIKNIEAGFFRRIKLTLF